MFDEGPLLLTIRQPTTRKGWLWLLGTAGTLLGLLVTGAFSAGKWAAGIIVAMQASMVALEAKADVLEERSLATRGDIVEIKSDLRDIRNAVIQRHTAAAVSAVGQ